MTDSGTVAQPTLSHSAKGSSVSQMICEPRGCEEAAGWRAAMHWRLQGKRQQR